MEAPLALELVMPAFKQPHPQASLHPPPHHHRQSRYEGLHIADAGAVQAGWRRHWDAMLEAANSGAAQVGR